MRFIVSHHKLAPKSMRAGGHYHYLIILVSRPMIPIMAVKYRKQVNGKQFLCLDYILRVWSRLIVLLNMPSAIGSKIRLLEKSHRHPSRLILKWASVLPCYNRSKLCLPHLAAIQLGWICSFRTFIYWRDLSLVLEIASYIATLPIYHMCCYS